MSVIDRIVTRDTSQWVLRNIETLPARARFRAFNAVRSLDWANRIYDLAELPIPACYCALHATEEAVAAFISCAKVCGYGDDAKINLKDHRAKTTVSMVAQSVSNIVEDFRPALAYNQDEDRIIARLTKDGKNTYAPASTRLLCFQDKDEVPVTDFFPHIVERFEDINGLKEEVTRAQTARNAIFYADKKGLPTGFIEPEHSLERECQLTLGLIWASIDIHNNNGEIIPLVAQALRSANLVIEAFQNQNTE